MSNVAGDAIVQKNIPNNIGHGGAGGARHSLSMATLLYQSFKYILLFVFISYYMNIFRTLFSASRTMAPKTFKAPPAPTVPTAIKSREEAVLGDGG